jgi:archaellum component FlaC
MELFNLVISVGSFLGACVFIAMAWNHSKLIKEMQNEINNNMDACNARLRKSEDNCDRLAAWRNELMKKKHDDLSDLYRNLDNRVCDLTSTMWNIDGKIQTLDPYIKRIHLKHLIKTSGSINKGAIKQLKEIENELK